MVTCQSENQGAHMPAIKSVSMHKSAASSSSEFSLLKNDHQQEIDSNTSHQSMCKLKIDLMFNGSARSDNRSQLDDPQGSHRTRSIIIYGRNKLNNSISEHSSTVANCKHARTPEDDDSKDLANKAKKDVKRISSNVQAEIEQLFADVAKEASSTFAIAWLGCLPIKDKITTLEGLQKPLRELYLRNGSNTNHKPGSLDICANGLLIRVYASDCEKAIAGQQETRLTPFHNIAVWSAVRFAVSNKNGGAAFLPLITSPDNIDKSALFQPLSPTEYQRMVGSHHAPIFAIVMRSASMPKMLECHAFICKSTEDAIVIAATLYQSLMSHVTCSSGQNSQRRAPRNKNGISCVSIASSSDITNAHPITRRLSCSNKTRKNSMRSVNGSVIGSVALTTHSVRKKRTGNSLKSTNSTNNLQEIGGSDSFCKENKKKSYKANRAPPIPALSTQSPIGYESIKPSTKRTPSSLRLNKKHETMYLSTAEQNSRSHTHRPTHSSRLISTSPNCALSDLHKEASGRNSTLLTGDNNGDILTRVAIPRSGSFLNTGGLSRYKSKTARRYYDKMEDNTSTGGGGGGGSPLGFNELFNEFRLHENLHSLDEILYSIINADGMSFNDLKPIYKEFLLKLSLTLTKDELFQKSKNIMRRQRKRKFKYNNMLQGKQKNGRRLIFGTKSLKKVFQMGHFRSCRGNSPKAGQHSKKSRNNQKEVAECPKHAHCVHSPTTTCFSHRNRPHSAHQTQRHLQKCQRNRATTSSSDVSVVRTDNHVRGLNRNSSSGYVSCSECSYDSEDCTCTSADRCYCSLRSKKPHNKVRRKSNHRTVSKRPKKSNATIVVHTPSYNKTNDNRLSYISCNSDEKCYCSMTEEQDTEPKMDESDKTNPNNGSNTSWCDSDSCKSASKCYCKPLRRDGATLQDKSAISPNTNSALNKTSNKLALDYELFNIDANNSQPIQSHEALSVKKSVEAAAIFADFKLTQTTDIKSLCTRNEETALKKFSNTYHSYSVATRKSNRTKHLTGNCSTVGSNKGASLSLASNSSQISYTTDNLFNTLKNMEKSMRLPPLTSSIISNCNSEQQGCCDQQQKVQKQKQQKQDKGNPTSSITETTGCSTNYQSMRAVNHTLEDALGYLP